MHHVQQVPHAVLRSTYESIRLRNKSAASSGSTLRELLEHTVHCSGAALASGSSSSVTGAARAPARPIKRKGYISLVKLARCSTG
eukprot:17802-Heterococcus_DN1.PRE.3